MKKILSTIGLGVALMTGYAPSQAMAAIVSLSGAPGPNTWNYVIDTESDVFAVGSTVTVTTKAPLTGASTGFTSGGLTWQGSYLGTVATWLATSGTYNNNDLSGFSLTSSFPNGTVDWGTIANGGPSTVVSAGKTSGPVPEPATVMLLGIGGLVAGARKLYESRKDAVMA